MIAGEPASEFHTVEHWMMDARTATIYRVFDGPRCYEIGIQRLAVNMGAFDSDSFEEFTPSDDAKVAAALSGALRSLLFLN